MINEEKLINRLKNHRHTIPELSKLLKTSESEIEQAIKELKNIPLDIRQTNEGLSYHINLFPELGNVFHISDADNKYRRMDFGAISDLHFASKYHLPKTFHETMDRFEQKGISRVYVAGDIVDGVNIYKGHLENIVAASVDDQLDIAAEAFSKHPKLEFWGISGNHDYSFTQQNGIRPLAILEQKVDNFKNLGDLRADVIYHGIRIRLLHGASGRAYAKSYPSQTYLRDLFGGTEKEDLKNMPHIILLGHYHTLYVGKDHGIHIIQATSFQDGDNEYCIRKGLTGPNGGFHIMLRYKEGIIDEFNTSYIQPKIQIEEKGEQHRKNTKKY
jgi:predicted phosphodiesterase/biotin operon repressor